MEHLTNMESLVVLGMVGFFISVVFRMGKEFGKDEMRKEFRKYMREEAGK